MSYMNLTTFRLSYTENSQHGLNLADLKSRIAEQVWLNNLLRFLYMKQNWESKAKNAKWLS